MNLRRRALFSHQADQFSLFNTLSILNFRHPISFGVFHPNIVNTHTSFTKFGTSPQTHIHGKMLQTTLIQSFGTLGPTIKRMLSSLEPRTGHKMLISQPKRLQAAIITLPIPFITTLHPMGNGLGTRPLLRSTKDFVFLSPNTERSTPMEMVRSTIQNHGLGGIIQIKICYLT